MTIKKIWVEKYRPKQVSNIIFTTETHKRKFMGFVKDKAIPNLLLQGGPGTGKTSISRALIRDLEVNKLDVLTIRCSDEKIDAIRDKVKAFASTMPLGSFKIVRLEEFDNIGLDAQKLLRSLIEDTSSTTRYIATCNYVNRLIPEMRSRFQEFSFTAPSFDEVCMRSADILDAEEVSYDVEDIEKAVGLAYPDFRKVIQVLEAGSIDGKFTLSNDNAAVAGWMVTLLELLETGNFQQARKVVCETASREELIDVYRFLYNNLHRVGTLKGKEDKAFVLIAKYQYQHAFVSDPELQIAALFIELSML